MKKINILFLLFGCFLISGFIPKEKTDTTNIVVNNNIDQDPFLGTWQWQDGNQIFRVRLWDNIRGATKGHFEMVEVNSNGEETIIYTSDKPLNSATPQHWWPVISGGRVGNTNKFTARIMDNSMNYEAPEYEQYSLWEARLEMKIIQSGSSISSPTTASWKVGYYDLTPENAMPLQIPTDVIMTKVQ